ncbi:MAG: flagellar hook-associated protein FlgK [Synergistaceae bacterium]|nr:flagellar hook-associated protein FlgK [Synergistaceae bacterium]
MSSTFGGLEMGKSALNGFRLGMQTVGHNISNMNTEGYSRQRVIFSTVKPEDIAHVGQLGQGMYASTIERIRDEFLDFQYRDSQATLGYWEKVNDLYDAIQNYIPEPTSTGLRTAMDTFFTNMQTLQGAPEDTSARRALVESANSIGGMLTNLISNFNTYNESINMEVKQSVAEANQMLYDLAALNKEIATAEALDQNANDLYDKRDLILDKLSKMMDIQYNEPIEHNGVKGEFFLSVNGRVLVQGIHVRELKAHAFMWDGQVYYDVQVAENEFDIVDNINVAEALATGPEGTHQLTVDRIANGVEWTAGGGNAHCLETRVAKTSDFDSGYVLTEDSADIPYKLSFRTLSLDSEGNERPSVLTIKIDKNSDGTWQMRAELNGEVNDSNGDPLFDFDDDESTSATENLTINELVSFINAAASAANTNYNAGVNLVATANADPDVPWVSKSMTFTTDGSIYADSPIEITDYAGMLGTLTEVKAELTDVNMRVEPVELTDALNISGSFRIQVGTQGTRVTSNVFRETADLNEGEILAPGTAGERHTFRVGVSGDQVDFTAAWNSSTKTWILSSDLGNSTTTGSTLSVKDLSDFMAQTFTNASSSDNPALINMSVTAGKSSTGAYTQFYVESRENHLISISDVEGNLAERLGIVNKNPVITIDVENSDSLVTIRNKINEKYQAEFGLTEPEQWVHASIDKGYLEISANVAGEAQRITLMGSEDGNMQVLRRLGLTQNQSIITDIPDPDDGTKFLTSYREVAYIPDFGVASDASFSLDGVRYLSSDNKFNMARRIPALSGETASRYSATELSEVSEGLWLNLKSEGNAIIKVRHHIRSGSIKGLEEARDEMIPNLKSELDEMAYGLVKYINALQYSGYGVAGDITTTGVAFFDPLGMQSGASEKLKVTDRVSLDPSLIGAAMGFKDENGLALKGISAGAGDGTNASRMNDLNFAKVLEHGTITISGIYDAMLSQVGTEANHAKLMYTTQATVSEQIAGQRQAVSGVNLDEELMDMVILNRAFGAMSRYITTMDEMLNTIINGMGLVGR